MKQKRFGEIATIEALRNGYKIRYNERYTLNAGYKIIDNNGEIVGYITQDLFTKLYQNRMIRRHKIDYHYTDYILEPTER